MVVILMSYDVFCSDNWYVAVGISFVSYFFFSYDITCGGMHPTWEARTRLTSPAYRCRPGATRVPVRNPDGTRGGESGRGCSEGQKNRRRKNKSCWKVSKDDKKNTGGRRNQNDKKVSLSSRDIYSLNEQNSSMPFILPMLFFITSYAMLIYIHWMKKNSSILFILPILFFTSYAFLLLTSFYDKNTIKRLCTNLNTIKCFI